MRGKTPALRSRLVEVKSPQWTQSNEPAALRLIEEPVGMLAELTERVAASAHHACENNIMTKSQSALANPQAGKPALRRIGFATAFSQIKLAAAIICVSNASQASQHRAMNAKVLARPKRIPGMVRLFIPYRS